MGKTLQELLGFENLTGVVQDPKGGIPADVLPPAFLTVRKPIEGNTAKWFAVQGTRRTARLVQYGAPSQRRNLQGVTERSAVMIHSFEHTHHDVSTLIALQNFDNPTIQKMGVTLVDQQSAQFRQLFNNLELAAVYSCLAQGLVYFDEFGNLLATSAGAVVSVDFQVPAGNKNQCSTVIATKWPTVTAHIINQLRGMRELALKTSGYPLAHVFYGSSIPNWFMANTEIKEILKADAGLAASLRGGIVPNGFGGIPNWHQVVGMFFEDKDGTNQDLFAADTVVFTPEPSPDWWEIMEGSYAVPTNLRVGGGATEMIADFTKVFGMFSYAQITTDPPGIKHLAGHTFLPALKVPSAIFIADVNF